MKRWTLCGKWLIIALLTVGSLWASGQEAMADSPAKVVSAAGGYDYGIAAWSDGSVTGWGYNKYGQVGDGTRIDQYVPKKISGLENVIQVTAARDASFAVTAEGEVWAWGAGYSDSVNGDPVLPYQKIELPSKLEGLSDVTSIGSNGIAGIAVHKNGTATLWYIFYDSDYKKHIKYVPLKGVTGARAVQIMGNTALILGQDDTLRSLSLYNDYYGRYRSEEELKAPEILKADISRIAISWRDAFLLRKDGTVLRWNADSQKFTVVDGLKGISNIQTVGYNRLYALKQDGTVWQWNYNYGGNAKPFQVKGLSGITAIWGTTGLTGLAINKKGEFLAWSDGYRTGLAEGSGSAHNDSDTMVTHVQQALSWTVNGKSVNFYATSGVVGNKLYVPYTSVFGAMGVKISHEVVKATDPKAVPQSQSIWTFTYGERSVSINQDKPNSEIFYMSNSTVFPLETICEGLGINLKWNKATGEVVIQS
ncbi:chromosome condensation regulator RCC1 [Paenibacillus sp. KQZ6P-2]|uniref:Chromosome condensation regulator RCC1 n=1 Tax=Paenibacillus mangrovi TaxID=2931978 RepID=A0A9X2B274_9BACL|nr:chromosome condensation regulator RCC1 [Paenibacillus mangrovi]MCJ8012224.1 chromosome condensation regulator RCC1 [Paenibacillus mangrovi]